MTTSPPGRPAPAHHAGTGVPPGEPEPPGGPAPAGTDDGDRRLRWLKVAAYVVLALGVVAFVVEGADNPADPSVVEPSDGPDGARAGLAGFDEVAVTVAPPGGGGLLEWCLLLAATEAQRQRGLMEVTDPALGGYDGMLFRYEDEVSVGFYMRNTPMPLSIAYIDGDGRIASSTDMEPCDDVDGCPSYPPAGPFRWAVEVPQGGLDRLGLVGGATFTDTGRSCPA